MGVWESIHRGEVYILKITYFENRRRVGGGQERSREISKKRSGGDGAWTGVLAVATVISRVLGPDIL